MEQGSTAQVSPSDLKALLSLAAEQLARIPFLPLPDRSAVLHRALQLYRELANHKGGVAKTTTAVSTPPTGKEP
jgi:hypothetical protein